MLTYSKTLARACLCLLTALLLSCEKESGSVYYIDAEKGDDQNHGQSPALAWKSLENLNTTVFQPGDSILFHADQQWTGTVFFQGSGTAGQPIVVGKYGTGTNPVLNGAGKVNCSEQGPMPHHCTIYLFNASFWEISNLEITNYDPDEENGLSLQNWEEANKINFADSLRPPQSMVKRKRKSGILVEARDHGAIDHLHFKNLEIHGVNGDMTTKHNGGIFLRIYGAENEQPTYFNDLLFENCHIHDVDRTGISNFSYYDKRKADSLGNWTPSRGYIVRHNTFERTGANALILRVAHKPLIAFNLFDHCAIKGSGNAFFNFNTDSALMQFNESRFTKYNLNDHDAGGIDSDFKTRWTTLQYNYIHDNDFGPLVTGGPHRYDGFNLFTVVRFNVFENDGVERHPSDERKHNWVFKVSGNASQTYVHNNVFYIGPDKHNRAVLYHRDWGAKPDSTFYFNNVFHNLGTGSFYDLAASSGNFFYFNNVFGNPATFQPENQHGMASDPMFQSPGKGKDGYRIMPDSPLLNAGKVPMIGLPETDFYGHRLVSQKINIGVDQSH